MTVRYVYWQEGDLYEDLSQHRIPEVRRAAELEVG